MTKHRPTDAARDITEQPHTPEDELLYRAWVVIANAWGGDWSSASADWRQAAERWRDDWHNFIEQRKRAPSWPESSSARLEREQSEQPVTVCGYIDPVTSRTCGIQWIGRPAACPEHGEGYPVGMTPAEARKVSPEPQHLDSHNVAVGSGQVYAWCVPGVHRSAEPSGRSPEERQQLPTGWRTVQAKLVENVWIKDERESVTGTSIVVCPEHEHLVVSLTG